MAESRWTAQQQDAIDARRGTVLVSAAAGSGKTSVLVQRAIDRICDPENPTDADRLLVVTFTRAAAAEMRGRMERQLKDRLRKDSKNEMLRRQILLLPQASIGTMHSFCADTLRIYFHQLGISPDFRIITDKQEEELKSRVLSATLDAGFDSDMELLADAFSGDRDDSGLAGTVLKLYEYMGSHTYPEKWLREKAEQYFLELPAGQSPWGRVILERVSEQAEFGMKMTEKALELLEQDEKLAGSFGKLFQGERDQFQMLIDSAKRQDWDDTFSVIRNFSLGRLATPKGYTDNPLKIRVQAMREDWKKIIKDAEKLFIRDEEGCSQEFLAVGEIVNALAELTLEFKKNYTAKKAERDLFDYGDLEQQMIRLLVDENGNKTPAAHEISERFDEIMIDEYQDINEVQSLIFKTISADESNLFMVGDVKQSIYGFRRAMPEIFINTKSSLQKYDREQDRYPAYVVLDRNFRSRKNVTESVNFVFTQIMNKYTGDIDYNSEEELVYGANFPEKKGCETRLEIVERREGESLIQAEAAQIARDIKELMDNGFTVTEKGSGRPVEFRDFCVLLRSANNHAQSYVQELNAMGIPAKSGMGGGFFEAREIGLILSFLKIIDNPNQDIPLLTVLMSPVYGFTVDDMLQLRQQRPEASLYELFVEQSEKDARYKAVAGDIEHYRAASATMPADGFIELLYRRTGYKDMVLAMDGGEGRDANLRQLKKYATDFEGYGDSGVSGFVRFLERLADNRMDLQAAELTAGSENCVHIMSIHKSKGLEFPVCIIAACDRRGRNRTDAVELHPELGIGIDLADRRLGLKYDTVSKEAVKLDNARREKAEEMRILYVAMTRAQEKLIMLAAVKDVEKKSAGLAAKITGKKLSNFSIKSAGSFADWLILCALRHPDGKELRQIAGADDIELNTDFYTPWEIKLTQGGELEPLEESVTEAEQTAQPDMELYERVKSAVEFRYKDYALSLIPSKVTASGLTSAGSESGWNRPLARPSWLGEKGLTAAERGTALHDYMQYADYSVAASDAKLELERLVSQEFLSSEQAAAIDLSHIESFFKSSTGRRVLASKNIKRERRFSVEIPAGMAIEELETGFEDTPIVLQGAVDCTFIEDNKIHIIDFKTDRIKDISELLQSYERQMELYIYAMNEVSGYEVGDCILYSMYKDEALTVKKK